MKRKQKKATKPSARQSMPGFDYGLEKNTAVLAAPNFNGNLRTANIVACAYGGIHNEDVDAAIPVVMLVATKPDQLKDALRQFREWIDATGPDALSVEILYWGDGYYIGLGPDYKHLLWRTVGLDQTYSPIFFGLTYIKKIDSRHSMVNDLARYGRQLVAPVLLTGAKFTGKTPSATGPNPGDLERIPDCPELLLLRLPVYETSDEVPKFSGLRSCICTPTKTELANSQKQFHEQAVSPDVVFIHRDRRMSALMPVTLHMLRTFEPLQEKLNLLEQEGVERWQLEQAILNQRLWSLTNSSQRRQFQNTSKLHEWLASFMELDRPDLTAIVEERDAILKQVLRDARALLKGIGARAAKTLPECQAQLEELGYRRQKLSAA